MSGRAAAGSAELIAVDHVSKTYETRTGPVTALDDIHFAIEEGQFVAIVGPSGCGKSTLQTRQRFEVRPSRCNPGSRLAPG